jgi:hypothetical protein
MAFTEDFSVFFDDNGFGVDFAYTPKVGNAISATGIFDAAYFGAEGAEVTVTSSQPRIVYQTSLIPEPLYGDAITVNDEDYTIVGIQPDGTGITTLILEKADDAC